MESHRKSAPCTHRIVGFALALTRDLDPFHAPGKCGQDDFGLHAGDSLADTTVDAHAKFDVARGVTPDVEAMWVAPPTGIVVSRSKEE